MGKKNFNLPKEMYRGTIKQVMKVRGFRTINLTRFNQWRGVSDEEISPVHSLKYNLQDGYINMFDIKNNKISDEIAESMYPKVYSMINEILSKEKEIPYKQRKNILVKINR